MEDKPSIFVFKPKSRRIHCLLDQNKIIGIIYEHKHNQCLLPYIDVNYGQFYGICSQWNHHGFAELNLIEYIKKLFNLGELDADTEDRL